MQISKEQPMRSALNDVIDAVNDINDIGPYVTDAVDDWLDEHPEATTTVQDDSLTTAKYQDGSVTSAKLSNNAVTTEKIADGSVTYDKIHEPDSFMVSGAESVTNDAAITREYLHAPVPDGIGNGLALIEAVYGRTLVWNQLVKTINGTTQALTGVTRTITDGVVVMNGTAAEASASRYVNVAGATFNIINGHKYLVNLHNGSLNYYVNVSGAYSTAPTPRIFTATENQASGQVILIVPASEYTFDNATFIPQLFDLTTMFGVGNEPATVAEFEALFPEPYYPYDPGSLLSVRMEGMETVGFNQWDEVWEVGEISDQTGQNSSGGGRIRAKNLIPCFANTSYYLQSSLSTNDLRLYYYDADKGYIGHTGWLTNGAITTPTGCRYMRFATGGAYGAIYKHDICISLSGPRNGTYEPYWRSERTIPASTYFPDGMRSAGSVADELRADAAITRVGERAYQSGDESDASVITDGIVTHYALATPTTTPINPPLKMSYKVEQDGTERVMVASGTQSAPPIFATRYPVNLTALAASIAPRESTIATGNHAIGDLIMLGWTLCKATQVIVTGETIEIGTNVTRTSVAAEIAALS